MKFNVKFHDIGIYLKERRQPIFGIERPLAGDGAGDKPFAIAQPGRVGTFWVPTRSLIDDDHGWEVDSQSDVVRVPMHSYKTPTASKSRLVAAGIEVGWKALHSLMPLTPDEPTEMLIIMGHECHVVDKGYAYYVGLLIRTK